MPASVELKRSLNLPLLTLYGLGNILGAGIYVLVGKVAGVAGLYAPIAFGVACFVAAISALTYAELSARFPVSAGEAVYVQEGIGYRRLSIAVGLMISLAGLVSAATLCRGAVGYVQVFLEVPQWLAISGLIVVLGALAVWGIMQAVTAAALITLVEAAGLVLIIAVGAESFTGMPERLPDLVPPMTDAGVWQGILMGAFLAFYAFIGFEDMVNVAEEVKSPQRNMPLGILWALLIATVMYLLVSLVAVLTVEPLALAESDAPLAAVYQQATGREPVIISLIGIFAVVNGALIQIIMASRILYGMGRQGWVSSMLGEVHPVTRTPVKATVLVTVVVWILALGVPLVTLAKSTSFIVLAVFALVNISLWRVKRRDPHPQGVRVFPAWVPVAGFVLCTGLIAFEILSHLK